MGTNASPIVSIFLADGLLVGTNRVFFTDVLTVPTRRCGAFTSFGDPFGLLLSLD
jgi:hypothetical protein